MTLREARKYFRKYLQENIITLYGKNDEPALNLAFNDWVDSLHREGVITDRQANTWTRT